MKHPLQWSKSEGILAVALGISDDPNCILIERTVQHALEQKWSMRELFHAVGEMDISDEMWANFLYTYGWWDGQRHL